MRYSWLLIALILVSAFVMNSNAIDRIRSREMAKLLREHSDNKLYWLVDRILKTAFYETCNPMRGVTDVIHPKKAFSMPDCIRHAHFEIVENEIHAMMYSQVPEVAEEISKFSFPLLPEDMRRRLNLL